MTEIPDSNDSPTDDGQLSTGDDGQETADGRVLITLDAELAWGFHDLADWPVERIRSARSSWIRLLALFDEFGIPATWTVVGHLFLDSCDGIHAEHPAPPGWFDPDPGPRGGDDWFGPDLIEQTRSAAVDHEIGCHTFSHVLFGDNDTTALLASAEVQACVDLARARDLSLRSFSFPRNMLGHRAALATNGIQCYRGVAPQRWFDRLPFRRPGKLLDFLLGVTPPPVVRPIIDEYGLVNVPASLELYSFEGLARAVLDRVNGDPIQRQVELGLDAARDSGDILHLWCHPNDLTTEADFDRMRAILESIARRRDRGELVVETMGSVAATVLAEQRTDTLEQPSDRDRQRSQTTSRSRGPR